MPRESHAGGGQIDELKVKDLCDDDTQTLE